MRDPGGNSGPGGERPETAGCTRFRFVFGETKVRKLTVCRYADKFTADKSNILGINATQTNSLPLR